jgi:hypothetical protein
LEASVKHDVALTAAGMPALVLGETRYPLLFSISAIKEWAEFKGLSFKEAARGWNSADLDEEDIRCLLRAALRAGERRRVMFDEPPVHEISEALLDHLLGLLHPDEASALLVLAWSQPPREPDPPGSPESLPAGETSSG